MRPRVNKFATLNARHLGVPLQLTWYKDLELKNFVKLTTMWEKGEEIKPTFVITGFGLHWMKNRPLPVGFHYRNFFTNLVPHLSRLASTVPVFFKLVDYVILAMRRKNTSTGINFQATEMYNDIARQLLQGTGVVLWDSTLPLSVIYANECMKTRRLTPITYDWKCHDVNHLGYIMLEQYADMVYNGICNRYLDLSDEYCNVNG
ncbi:uncharacterized protein LOC119582157 [Penaeus monodon]|uniref:uncharacterized protein LOC119582157 n=1 Tax=Penaeus monodon TaxID=6687 RepID=UPI0018A7D038|nr:uncharacterized protein LOC119582157 [Penaeus monodon]